MSEQSEWRDRLVGARMSVDSEYDDRVEASSFTRQQWGLIMTATEFDIEDGEEPTLVADTDKLEDIMPEIEKVKNQGPMGESGDSGGGILGSITSALGLGGGSGDPDYSDQLEEAQQLTDGYARELQSHLESRGSWESVLEAYRSE